MKNTYRFAIAIATASFAAALLIAQAPARQAPAASNAEEKEKALKAKRIAQQFAANAAVLTIFDRQGKVVSTVGERAIYVNNPVFSPDRTRLAVIKRDLENDIDNLWVFDVATGTSTQITSNTQTRRQEQVRWPIWSPDGSQLAYTALRDGYWGLYQKASNGEGVEQLLHQSPGGPLPTDWSLDGRFLHFHLTDLSGGTLYVLPAAGDGPHTPIQVLHSEFQVRGSRLSPDGRFLAYQSNQSGKEEIYVQPFDPSAPGAAPSTGPWQVSDGTQPSPAFWRSDGKELFYVAGDRGVMAVDVSTTPTFKLGKPKLLFRLSEAVTVDGGTASISRDGQRIVIAVPAARILQQITMFDRQGKVLSKVGELGRYGNLALSPDGTRLAAESIDPRTGNFDILTFDLASGKGTPFANDNFLENAPIWSPDGRQVAYVSRRKSFTSIYRKAWDGTGNEEQLFQYTPGAFLVLTDWSPDGKFLTFHDGCSGVLNLVSLTGNQKPLDRKAIEWLRDEYNVAQARFSPDSRFIAYLSNEGKTKEEINSGINEVYVRPFDPTKSDVSSGSEKPVRVSTAGARGMIFWRQDGKEMYYLTPDWEVMAVDVTTTPTFHTGTPRLLFKVPGRLPLLGSPEKGNNVSSDGQRLVFNINVPVSISGR